MFYLIWALIITAVAALYLRKVYSRFSKYGVKNPKLVPLLGNMYRVMFRINHFAYETTNVYHAFHTERFVGVYEFTRPMIIIRDLELIKKITIKDFEDFLDHRGFADSIVEPIFQRNIFFLKGQEWKDMRSTLSPAFTGAKIRYMVPFVEEVAKQMISALRKNFKESDETCIEVDCKDLTNRYANDVIASCAFGLKVDSLNVMDNEFYEMGKSVAFFNFRQIIKFTVLGAFPSLGKLLRLQLFSDEIKNFFVCLVLNTMKDRESKNFIRPDMIHLLMEARKGQLKHDDKETSGFVEDSKSAIAEHSIRKNDFDIVWSDIDLVAQAVIFLIAGFETVSTALSFALHEIALHPEIQEKLVAEIEENEEKHSGKMDYDSIQNMTYMDMVISETLRLWPPIVIAERSCNKNYNLGTPNEKATKDYILQKGDVIQIPVWAIHRDPNYFSNPDKFDPERFSKENKHLINPLTYMPFGLGPRICIGARFAFCEMKIFLYYLLRDMVVSPSSRTVLPARLSTEFFNIQLQGGHWVKFSMRR